MLLAVPAPHRGVSLHILGVEIDRLGGTGVCAGHPFRIGKLLASLILTLVPSETAAPGLLP